MTDNKRIKECKRKVIAAINEATLPFAVTVLRRRKPTMAYDRSGRGTARKSYSRR